MSRLLHVVRNRSAKPQATSPQDAVVYVDPSAGTEVRYRYQDQSIDSAALVELIFACDHAIIW